MLDPATSYAPPRGARSLVLAQREARAVSSSDFYQCTYSFRFHASWTGGRVVEGTGLENRHTCKGIESSNLSLSVSSEGPEVARAFLLVGILERCWDGWPSGLRRTPGKCVYVNSVPWVRIPPRPLEGLIPLPLSQVERDSFCDLIESCDRW